MRDESDKPTEFTPHPYALIFPPMTEEERADLEADIKRHGLREKIVVNSNNQILDGVNRYRACTSLDIPPAFEIRNLADKEALAFIRSRNLVRRHLTVAQRAYIADQIAGLQQGQRRKGANLPVLTQAEAAKAMNVSLRSVKTARKVAKASPELAGALKAGTITLHAAEHITELPEPQRGIAISELTNAKPKRPARCTARSSPGA
jgi:ParB-like chromosome segregation protein Spo0J